MRRLLLLYKPEIIYFTSILLLSIWALSATLIAVTKKDRVVIFKIDSNGDSEVIGSESDLGLAEPFAYRYVQLMYNYDYESFETNVKRSLPLLTQAFWDKLRPDYIKSIPKLRERKVIQTTAIVTRIAKTSENTFVFGTKAEITRTDSSDRRISETQKQRIQLTIKRVQRTLENPYGWEVADVTEEAI